MKKNKVDINSMSVCTLINEQTKTATESEQAHGSKMKAFVIRVLSLLILTSFCTVLVWHYSTHSDAPASDSQKVEENPANSNDAPASDSQKVEENPANSNDAPARDSQKVEENPANSNDADASDSQVDEAALKAMEIEMVDQLMANYTSKWKKHEKNFNTFRTFLSNSCDAISNATVTQENTLAGTIYTYDGDNKRKVNITEALFSIFPKESPFKKAPYDTCAVVGNGGILTNSSCGRQIDSATFVIRCNLPPVTDGHEKDTGRKTSFVTGNPSIFKDKYQSLNDRRRPFVEDMQLYQGALLLLPAFSFKRNTAVSLRVLYSLEDLTKHGPYPVFSNPYYLNKLTLFWRDQGIHVLRLSTGIMMASLALELCKTVHLYGFWPFGVHPYTHQPISNHYFDDRPVNTRLHKMSTEFQALLNLHNKGVIHLHLDKCAN
ncbi:alpha-2,8-sialyltransferase 8F-like isoform X4 [Neoarius graeffei]|uniref:alpha-2,8-sialyltransferase 8F-like isoform X4 n=1 Tax=Neoarius graeffei TaxID=443677 RepID=UPI00298D3D56|nr:alpha-2,8-sialyltransferase 8F-like isoform X4 [Neoarius graeffei]